MSNSAKSEVCSGKNLQPANNRISKVMFASGNRVKIPSKSITTFGKILSFSAISDCIGNSVFTAKYNKSGKRSIKRYSISFQKKEILNKILFWQQCFPSVKNNESPNGGFMKISHCIPITIRV